MTKKRADPARAPRVRLAATQAPLHVESSNVESLTYRSVGAEVEVEVVVDLGSGRDGPVPPNFDPWSFDLSHITPAQVLASEPWLRQAFAAHGILQMRTEIEANGYALLNAIATVAKHDLRMPDWLAAAYLARWQRVTDLEAHRLEDAFGSLPHRKGKAGLKKLRRDRELIPQLNRALVEKVVADPDTALSKDLFEEVGRSFNVGGTKADTLYRQGVASSGLQDLKDLKDVLKLLPEKKKPANQ